MAQNMLESEANESIKSRDSVKETSGKLVPLLTEVNFTKKKTKSGFKRKTLKVIIHIVTLQYFYLNLLSFRLNNTSKMDNLLHKRRSNILDSKIINRNVKAAANQSVQIGDLVKYFEGLKKNSKCTHLTLIANVKLNLHQSFQSPESSLTPRKDPFHKQSIWFKHQSPRTRSSLQPFSPVKSINFSPEGKPPQTVELLLLTISKYWLHIYSNPSCISKLVSGPDLPC